MNIINLTPHTLNLRNEDGEMIEISPSGIVARVGVQKEELASVAGFRVTRSYFGEIENLPSEQENTIYVVSAMVLQRVERGDVFAPGEAIRDSEGKIVGAEGLSAK